MHRSEVGDCVLAGVVVAFQAHQLPNPLVEVTVPGHVTYQAAAKQTLKPHFQTAEPARFQRLASDAMMTVRLYDDKAGRKKHLLGEAQLSCSHIQARLLTSSALGGRMVSEYEGVLQDSRVKTCQGRCRRGS